jgi:hypothetical protein
VSAREELALLLVRHQRIPIYNGTAGQRCTGCDSLHGETDGPNSPRHGEHLADLILASDWLAAREAAAAEQARAEVVAAVSELVDEWEQNAGEDSAAWRVYGPQSLSVPFAVDSIRAALATERDQ